MSWYVGFSGDEVRSQFQIIVLFDPLSPQAQEHANESCAFDPRFEVVLLAREYSDVTSYHLEEDEHPFNGRICRHTFAIHQFPHALKIFLGYNSHNRRPAHRPKTIPVIIAIIESVLECSECVHACSHRIQIDVKVAQSETSRRVVGGIHELLAIVDEVHVHEVY